MIYEIENEETLSIYLYKLACIFLLLYNQVKIALKNGFFWYTHTQIKYLFIIIFFWRTGTEISLCRKRRVWLRGTGLISNVN